VTSQDATTLSTTALADMERMTILRVFEQANGDKALAGKMLGSAAQRCTETEALQHCLKSGPTGGGADPQAAPQ